MGACCRAVRSAGADGAKIGGALFSEWEAPVVPTRNVVTRRRRRLRCRPFVQGTRCVCRIDPAILLTAAATLSQIAASPLCRSSDCASLSRHSALRAMVPPERSLLRLGLLVRLALAAVTLAAQWPLWRPSAATAADPPSLASHYDASAQLMQIQSTRECTHLANSPIERAIITALNSQGHWDGQDQTHREDGQRPSYVARWLIPVSPRCSPPGLHFLSILHRRGYDVEKETAFFPGLPAIVGGIGSGLAAVFDRVGFPLCSYTTVLIAAALLSLALCLTNVILLYRLSLRVLSSPRLAYLSAVCFLFSPASVFHAALYSEGLFTACALGGMLLREQGRSWSAAVLFALSTSCRANGYLLAGFFAWDALQAARAASNEKVHGLRRLGHIVAGWPAAAVQAAIVFAPFVAFQLYAALLLCTSASLASSAASSTTPAAQPYCSAFFPNVYSFVQSRYWNVGWFRYYEWKQLPNFVLAAPVWTLSLLGIRNYAMHDWMRFATLGFKSTAMIRDDTGLASKQPPSVSRKRPAVPSSHPPVVGFASDRVFVYIYLWSGLLFICVTVLHGQSRGNRGQTGGRAARRGSCIGQHVDPRCGSSACLCCCLLVVQVSTRFLSFCPPLYWFAATLLDSAFSSSASSPHASRTSSLLRGWSATYMLLGTLLFSSFLPWT